MRTQGNYTINDIERLTGIKAHTIRIWEKRYGLCDPGRTNGNIRHYTDDDLRRMLNVAILRKNGFKISEIAAMTEDELHAKLLEGTSDSPGDPRIEEMILAMINLDEEAFRHLLQGAFIESGIEQAFSRVIHPFFNRIGVMWLAGSINPAQEHFVSNIIRQKLIVAINNLEIGQREGSRRFLLFLPEHEQHELGLLLYSYLIKRAGHKVIYLGQSTPYECVRNVTESQAPEFIFTSLTAPFEEDSMRPYLERLLNDHPNATILLSGLQVWENEQAVPSHPNIQKISGGDALKAFLLTLQPGMQN